MLISCYGQNKKKSRLDRQPLVWREWVSFRASKAMGLNISGVDLLRSNHGPVVMEVNSSPGLEGIEKTTGKDIAGLMIEYLEKNAKHVKTTTKGKG